ncbi:hypothetical protein PFTANZ_05924, partial [Plasmodium falciparum Tanzania (2000708)]
MQQQTREEMLKRSVKEGDKGKSGNSCLVGNIKEAKFGKAAKSSDLDKGKICDLDEHKHTNVQDNKRGYYYNGPCTGKNDKRFKIGTQWSYGEKEKENTHPKVYMPARREHMCTSNLEHLDIRSKGLTGTNAGHSLLGDVLLAAKYEAENIKKLYVENNDRKDLNAANDKATVCRAMKYSFADIGDIIRGRDMWVQNKDFRDLQTMLVTIFGKIDDELKSKLNGKYEDNSEGKHLELRKDWWEANRDQVWEAMKCKTNGVDITCDSDHTPLDDYIPQRLRWMNEWAEWYCKVQKKAYEELVKGCKECKGGKCMNGDPKCTTCMSACAEYWKKIQPWKQQWEKIKEKYNDLYKRATESGGPIKSNDPKDQEAIEFLSKLQKKNTDNTIYSTAAGYIHQEATMNCEKQTQFCEKKSGGDDDTHYVFRGKPHDYDEACDCEDREGPKAPKEKKEDHVYSGKKKPCDIVEEHFKLKDNKTGGIDSCYPKDYGGTYPGWNCTNETLVSGKGECMPPRRQKLCLINLQYFTGKTTVDLREAFIKCAAVETFFLWHKYKDDKEKVNPSKNVDKEVQKKLESGEIPEDFKRQMFYTFGDYRDIFFDTDISKKQGPVKDAIDNIGKVFEKEKISEAKKDGKTDDKEREKFWKENGKEIWEGMLCGLSHASGNKETVQKTLTTNYTYPNVKFSGDNTTSLEHFAQRPQFLRWFTEWGDDFCKQRKEKLATLQKECPAETCIKRNESKKEPCKKACEKYQTWLKDWKTQYKTQSKKYDEDKGKQLYKNISDVTSSTKAYQYLHTQLKQFTCVSGDCNCMKEPSKETKKPSDTIEMPASLDEEPDEVKGRCKCPPPPDACEIVKVIFNGKSATDVIQGCKRKENYQPWNCDKIKSHNNHNGACMPPRRQKLCVINLKTFKPKTSVELRNAFIKCAAIETHFAWHRYKEDKENEKTTPKLVNYLKEGKIPDDFKRQMFYTFGDYRDLCLDKNIGNDVSVVENNIKDVLTDSTKNGGTPITAENWWKLIEKEVWDGMLCALSYNTNEKQFKDDVRKNLTQNYSYSTIKFTEDPNSTSLSTFAETPQFLRWFTEWGEDFCKKRKEKVNELMTKCNGCIVSDNPAGGKTCVKTTEGCKKCTKECETYQGWLKKWKENYNKQKDKFLRDKSENNYDHDPVAKKAKDAREYLEKTLQKFCQNGSTNENCDFKCMENASTQSLNNTDMPASLDDEPEEVQGKCSCKPPPPKNPPRLSLARSAEAPEEIPPAVAGRSLNPRPAPAGPQPPSGTPDA